MKSFIYILELGKSIEISFSSYHNCDDFIFGVIYRPFNGYEWMSISVQFIWMKITFFLKREANND